MRILFQVMSLGTGLLLQGCNVGLAPCVQGLPLTKSDGSVFSCIRPEDCPRPSNVLVCTSTKDQVNDCVSCEQARCVRFSRAECP